MVIFLISPKSSNDVSTFSKAEIRKYINTMNNAFPKSTADGYPAHIITMQISKGKKGAKKAHTYIHRFTFFLNTRIPEKIKSIATEIIQQIAAQLVATVSVLRNERIKYQVIYNAGIYNNPKIVLKLYLNR